MILTATTGVLPVFFVLALGYFAGRARKFDPDQVAGLNELVLDYALPAMLFVATVKTPRERLLSGFPNTSFAADSACFPLHTAMTK